MYFLLGSTMEMNIGPTAIMALMTYQYSSSGGSEYAILLCFISGIIELVSGIMNLGKGIRFTCSFDIYFLRIICISSLNYDVKGYCLEVLPL